MSDDDIRDALHELARRIAAEAGEQPSYMPIPEEHVEIALALGFDVTIIDYVPEADDEG